MNKQNEFTQIEKIADNQKALKLLCEAKTFKLDINGQGIHSHVSQANLKLINDKKRELLELYKASIRSLNVELLDSLVKFTKEVQNEDKNCYNTNELDNNVKH